MKTAIPPADRDEIPPPYGAAATSHPLSDLTTPRSSPSDQALAKVCLKCPVCRRARARQRGAAFLLAQKIEGRVCPFCRAYARGSGRRAHEPSP